jgi:hypothetical protein
VHPSHGRGFEDVLNADAELLEALGPYVLRFRFLLDDLSVQSDAELSARSRMTPGGRVAILSLKHGRSAVAVRIRVLSPDGRALATRDVLGIVLRYILETSRADPAEVRRLLARQLGREAAEEIMTTAEMLQREGEARGKREMLVRLLRRRFGDLPASSAARIDKASVADLNRWGDRVLTAESLAEVLGTKARRRAQAPAHPRASG